METSNLADLLTHVVHAAADAFIMVDVDGVVIYWNTGAQRIFGYSEQEALGTSLDLIIPERLRQRHWNAFHQAIATGTSRYGASDLLAVPAVTRDGRTISVEFSIVLWRNAGAVVCVGAIMRDVTDRRANEMELRRRIAALEASHGPGGFSRD